jgi:hypothetical protein
MSDIVRVRYAAGRADVHIGDRSLTVERRDDDARAAVCPIELISAALGS